MSMKCETCQVALNSVGQYQQHLNGRNHAKKLKQAEEASRPQAKSQGQGQNSKQGRGRGRAIRGAGGRGRGGPFMRGGQVQRGGRGRAGSVSFVTQPGVQLFSQTPPAGMEVQAGLQFTGQVPHVDPAVMGALNVTAYQGTNNTGQGFGRGGQQTSTGSYQLFGNSQTTTNNNQFFASSNQPFGTNQYGQNQYSQNQYGNSQYGNKQYGHKQYGFGNQQQHRQFFKSQKAKQPPPQRKVEPAAAKEPVVFGDHMGIASVSMEGNDLLYCKICSISLTSVEQAEYHYRGVKHLKKARVARLREVGALDEDGEGCSNGYFYCNICNIMVNSADQMKVHKEGSRHKKMVEHRKRKTGEAMDTEPSPKKSSPDPASSDTPAMNTAEGFSFTKTFETSQGAATPVFGV